MRACVSTHAHTWRLPEICSLRILTSWRRRASSSLETVIDLLVLSALAGEGPCSSFASLVCVGVYASPAFVFSLTSFAAGSGEPHTIGRAVYRMFFIYGSKFPDPDVTQLPLNRCKLGMQVGAEALRKTENVQE